MKEVYDRINELYCRKHNTNYTQYSAYNEEGRRGWWDKLLEKAGIGFGWIYGFNVFVTKSVEGFSEEFVDYCNQMPNGRQIFYLDYDNSNFVPKMNDDFLDNLKDITIIRKPSWSYKRYYKSRYCYYKKCCENCWPYVKKPAIGTALLSALVSAGYGGYKVCKSEKKQHIDKIIRRNLNGKRKIDGTTKRHIKRNQSRVQQTKRVTNQKKRNLQ